jgi:phosphoribosylanthranilate isomerase
VKVCGLTTAEDALQALQAGADALGFVFHPASPRSLEPQAWPALRAALPPWSYCVAVFASGDEPRIPEVLGLGGFAAFQLHGETAGEVPVTGHEFYRALDPARDDPEAASAFLAAGEGRRLLLDPRRGSLSGGTGEGHGDEDLAGWLQRFPGSVVAGGLGPDNVAEVVRRHRPLAVDASSRLEAEPGRKDPAKVVAFVAAAKGDHGNG